MQEGRSEDNATVFPRWVPWALVGIVALSIPWYWPSGTVRPFVMGMPIWAFLSLLCCGLFAVVTSFVILRYWRE